MKISFIGLSCFLIENRKGYRILIDPFNDSPEWTLGPKFPDKFDGKPFGTNLVLVSEPDADHSGIKGDWLANAPKTNAGSNPFPDLNLKGTVIYEYNGDLNICWHYTVDGMRLAHFADNAHILTDAQLKEIGNPDIIFISPPKIEGNEEAISIVKENIKLLNPKLIIWSHYIVPGNLPQTEDKEILKDFFINYFKKNASTNKFYKDEKSFMELYNVYENAKRLNREYDGVLLAKPTIEINKPDLTIAKSLLFNSMIYNLL